MDSDRDAHARSADADANTAWSPDPEEIALLAYSYYEQRGCVDGAHDDDWRRAEEELRARRNREQSAPPGPAPQTARVVAAAFRNVDGARRAFDALIAEGFSASEISFVAHKAVVRNWGDRAPASMAANAAGGAEVGAVTGAVGGLLLSFAGLAVPGIGTVVAAGPIVAALGGAGLGAATGGLIAVLSAAGLPADDAGKYAEAVRRGVVLVIANASGDRATEAVRILDEEGAIDIEDRVADWRRHGWQQHDTAAPPLSDSDLSRERKQFKRSRRGPRAAAARMFGN